MIEMNKSGYWPSTPNTNLLYALSEACDMLQADGLPKVFARHQRWAAGVRAAVNAWGLPIPFVTCILGAVGIVAARPFTVRAEADLGWKMRLLVSFIMLVLVQLWIIESRPGWLFAFVVAIGLAYLLDRSTDRFTYRDLQERRELIKTRFEKRGVN
jgi:hypothetical protein